MKAYTPNPADGAMLEQTWATLSWIPGTYAVSHDVYLGEDFDDVNDGIGDTFRGNQGDTFYVAGFPGFAYPNGLVNGTTYYWRIDEVNEADPNSPWIGDTWSFTTGNYLVIEDFEDYNDYPPDEVWSTWLDGYENPLNGSTAGYPDPDFVFGEHYLEDSNVHSGQWSMPLFYDNSAAPISEVTRTFDSSMRNWNRDDVVTLTLFFCGDPNNLVEPMFVAVDSAVVTHENPDAALITEWTRWDIPLQSLADLGVNLNSVGSMTIGFGNKANPTSGGGAGHVFFDDIRLYREE